MADALKIYISGPMTGLPEHNYPAFHDAARSLRAMGFSVSNPAEYPHDGPPETFPIRKAFAAYCDFLCLQADAICMLPGWQTSQGAQIEYRLARYLGLDVFTWANEHLHRLVKGAANG